MNTDCIEHEGARNAKGYGKVLRRSTNPDLPTVQMAHRWAWIQAHGEIPEELLVRHKCDNPPCINVDHLELGTDEDNARDRDSRGRNFQVSKTHCPKGHPYSGDNLFVQATTGKRQCRTCLNEAALARYYRNKKKAGQ